MHQLTACGVKWLRGLVGGGLAPAYVLVGT